MNARYFSACCAAALIPALSLSAADDEPRFTRDINVKVPPLGSDPLVKVDYGIVYVRAPRAGDDTHKRFYADLSQPVTMEPGADLMLLHTDGSEERLVAFSM